MPKPSTSLATSRPALAGSLEEFSTEMDRLGFISQRALRVLNTAVASGPFGKIPIEQLLKNPDVERAPGSAYARGNWTFTTDTFACKERGYEEPIDDREAAMYADYFDAELMATRRAFFAVLQAQEKRVADLLFNATTWTGASLTTGITHEWDDATNAVPITDVEAACRKVYALSGLWPNALIINRNVFRNLRNCDQIIERIQSAGAGSPTKPTDITVQQLAQCFDLSYILVGGGSKNSSKEGQTAAIAQIWSDEYAMVARVAETDDIREPAVGRIFHYTGDGSDAMGAVETYRDEKVRGDVVRVRHDVEEKVLYTEAAHLLSNITT